ncbi:hypothetical protein RUND412_007904 [Rhizina undulata]
MADGTSQYENMDTRSPAASSADMAVMFLLMFVIIGWILTLAAFMWRDKLVDFYRLLFNRLCHRKYNVETGKRNIKWSMSWPGNACSTTSVNTVTPLSVDRTPEVPKVFTARAAFSAFGKTGWRKLKVGVAWFLGNVKTTFSPRTEIPKREALKIGSPTNFVHVSGFPGSNSMPTVFFCGGDRNQESGPASQNKCPLDTNTAETSRGITSEYSEFSPPKNMHHTGIRRKPMLPPTAALRESHFVPRVSQQGIDNNIQAREQCGKDSFDLEAQKVRRVTRSWSPTRRYSADSDTRNLTSPSRPSGPLKFRSERERYTPGRFSVATSMSDPDLPLQVYTPMTMAYISAPKPPLINIRPREKLVLGSASKRKSASSVAIYVGNYGAQCRERECKHKMKYRYESESDRVEENI